MSAMPERVWLTRYDGWYTEPVGDGPCFVPESRLLAAEARVREVEAMLDVRTEFDAMREDRDMFRAERDALVPLARLGLGGLDGGSYYLDYLVRLGVSKPTGKETDATTQARAILAREET